MAVIAMSISSVSSTMMPMPLLQTQAPANIKSVATTDTSGADSVGQVTAPNAADKTAPTLASTSVESSPARDVITPPGVTRAASEQTQSQEKGQDSDSAQKQQQIDQVVAQLKARDQEVRTHEMAHVAAGGQYVTSGPSYTYQTGPDGQRYAIGGSVGIDTSPVSGDPEATLQKAQQVMTAAMAPAQPSSTDRQVASQASQMASQARADLAQAQAEDTSEGPTASAEDEAASEISAQSNQLNQPTQPDQIAPNTESSTSGRAGADQTLASTADASSAQASRAIMPGLSDLKFERNQFDLRMVSQSMAMA